MKKHIYYVYIVTNPSKTVLYIGVTNDLLSRIHQHYKNRGKPETFAGKYYCYKCIYVETFDYILSAIEREKEIKLLTRAKKEELIKSINPKMEVLELYKF